MVRNERKKTKGGNKMNIDKIIKIEGAFKLEKSKIEQKMKTLELQKEVLEKELYRLKDSLSKAEEEALESLGED